MMISEAVLERHSLGRLKYIYTYIYIYGATLATWSDIWSDIRYMSDICIKRSSLQAVFATLAIWSDTRYMANAHTCTFFPQCTIGNQVLSTSTRSASSEIHATALGSGGNSNGDRQIVFGEKIPSQTRSVAPPKRLRLFFWI